MDSPHQTDVNPGNYPAPCARPEQQVLVKIEHEVDLETVHLEPTTFKIEVAVKSEYISSQSTSDELEQEPESDITPSAWSTVWVKQEQDYLPNETKTGSQAEHRDEQCGWYGCREEPVLCGSVLSPVHSAEVEQICAKEPLDEPVAMNARRRGSSQSSVVGESQRNRKQRPRCSIGQLAASAEPPAARCTTSSYGSFGEDSNAELNEDVTAGTSQDSSEDYAQNSIASSDSSSDSSPSRGAGMCSRKSSKNRTKKRKQGEQVAADGALCDEEVVTCPECQRAFPGKFARQRLQDHLRTHSEERPFECDVCQRTFAQKRVLVAHKAIHSEEKRHSCEVCGRSFAQRKVLTVHMRTHSGDKSYPCDSCLRVFSHESSLNVHKKTHSGEKPFICDVCFKGFTTKKYLSQHYRVHTGERPFACDVCKESFAHEGTLISHRRIHTGEKPYECQLCPKAYSRLGALKVHHRVHTGERPYACDVCDKAFGDKSSLNKHMVTHDRDPLKVCLLWDKEPSEEQL